MGNQVTGGFIKVSEWINKIASTLIVAIIIAGFNDHMDTAANKRDIEVLKKADERKDAELAQLRADLREIDARSDERDRKSVGKLDQLIVLMQQRRR